MSQRAEALLAGKVCRGQDIECGGDTAALVGGTGGQHADHAGEGVAGADDAEARHRGGGARLGHGLQDLGDTHATGQVAPSCLE